jgi:hypothetical protein
MSIPGTPLLLFLLLLVEGQPVPKFPLGKETTYLTGPLDKDGYVDYEAAMNDRLGKGVTPERNAFALLWKAFGPRHGGDPPRPAEFYKRLGIEEPPKEGDYFIELDVYIRDRLKLGPGDSKAIEGQQGRAIQRPWAAEDYPYLATWLKANEKPLAVVTEATRRPEYFRPQVSLRTGKGPDGLAVESLSGVWQCRQAASALAARALLRVREGKLDAAWQDLLACHRLGRLVARGATFIDALTGIAIDQIASNAELAYLERAQVTFEQVQDRLKELHGLPPLADKVDLNERLRYLDLVRLVRCGDDSILEVLTEGLVKKLDPQQLGFLKMINWGPALRNGNLWYDRLTAALRLQDRAERNRELGQIDEELKALRKGAGQPARFVQLLQGKLPPGTTADKALADALSGLVMTGVRKMQELHDRAEQMQRNLDVAFALAAYHRDQGRYPAKLDDLAPKYLAAVPDDFFSGRALVYRPSEKGYLLYSVGVNGKDEDGRGPDDDPPGDDLGVRMPLPELKLLK